RARSAQAPSFHGSSRGSSSCPFSSSFGEALGGRRIIKNSNQPSAARVGEVVPAPVEDDRKPAAEADQEPDVRDAPEQPGGKSRQANAPEIRDCALAADGREVAVVPVAERLHGPSEDAVGDVATLLLGDRGHAGQGSPPPGRARGSIANREDPRLAESEQVVVDDHSAQT